MKLSISVFVLFSAAVTLASPFRFDNEAQTLERRLTLTSSSTGEGSSSPPRLRRRLRLRVRSLLHGANAEDGDCDK